jgi:hypothetical protein
MPFKELRQIPHSAVMSSSCVSTASDGTGPSNEFPACYPSPSRVNRIRTEPDCNSEWTSIYVGRILSANDRPM